MRKIIRRYIPDIETLNRQRWFRWMGPSVRHPRLWHLNRHSVAGAVAIGLFCSMIPGPGQSLAAAIACVWFKKNLPVAIVCTLVSNPLTVIPLFAAAFATGAKMTGSHTAFVAPPEFTWHAPEQSMLAYGHWLAALGMPLLLGLLLFAVVLSGTGYVAVQWCWRMHVRRQQQRRQANQPPS